MNIIILGPPGSGKSTQSKLLSDAFSLPHIISGDIARNLAKEHTPVGEEVKEDIKEGQLIPTELLFPKVREAIEKALSVGGFILDGYPRDPKESQMLLSFFKEKGIPLDRVIVIDLDRGSVLSRLLKRADDEKRSDDTLEAINERLTIYNTLTKEVIAELQSQGGVKEINGDDTVENVHAKIISSVSS